MLLRCSLRSEWAALAAVSLLLIGLVCWVSPSESRAAEIEVVAHVGQVTPYGTITSITRRERVETGGFGETGMLRGVPVATVRFDEADGATLIGAVDGAVSVVFPAAPVQATEGGPDFDYWTDIAYSENGHFIVIGSANVEGSDRRGAWLVDPTGTTVLVALGADEEGADLIPGVPSPYFFSNPKAVDLSDAGEPRLLGSVRTPGWTYAFLVEGLWISDGSGALKLAGLPGTELPEGLGDPVMEYYDAVAFSEYGAVFSAGRRVFVASTEGETALALGPESPHYDGEQGTFYYHVDKIGITDAGSVFVTTATKPDDDSCCAVGKLVRTNPDGTGSVWLRVGDTFDELGTIIALTSRVRDYEFYAASDSGLALRLWLGDEGANDGSPVRNDITVFVDGPGSVRAPSLLGSVVAPVNAGDLPERDPGYEAEWRFVDSVIGRSGPKHTHRHASYNSKGEAVFSASFAQWSGNADDPPQNSHNGLFFSDAEGSLWILADHTTRVPLGAGSVPVSIPNQLSNRTQLRLTENSEITFGTDPVFAILDPRSPSRPRCGDANEDVELRASDALLVLRAAVGSSACEACICDANADGAVAASDALLVLRYSVGQEVQLTCPTCDALP